MHALYLSGGCKDTYDSTPNKNANGATGYNQNTVPLCEAQCDSMANCVAFDFDPNGSPKKCWIHTDLAKASQLKDAPGVTHYVRKKCTTGMVPSHHH